MTKSTTSVKIKTLQILAKTSKKDPAKKEGFTVLGPSNKKSITLQEITIYVPRPPHPRPKTHGWTVQEAPGILGLGRPTATKVKV